MNYKELTSRNSGYISATLQSKIKQAKILFAGCGIGSQAALAAARLGFESFVLADGDTVSVNNLNRQAFRYSDVGLNKAVALKKAILEINPNATIETVEANLDASNTSRLVKGADLIFDTIDFLDLRAIVHLHDCALQYQKPLISCVAVGWGAAALYFPPESRHQSWIRDLFMVSSDPSQPWPEYKDAFGSFFFGIAKHIDPQVVQVLQAVMQSLAEGKPCPAPQVVSGAYAVASLAMTMAARVLNEQLVTCAPELILIDVQGTTHRSGINVDPMAALTRDKKSA